MKAVVLVAGYGTRLGKLTQARPKCMLPLHGQPVLAYILRHLSRQGFAEVALNVHHRAEQITGFFGDGTTWGVRLHYLHEPRLSGTAGPLARLSSWLGGEDCFLVMYGDVLTDQDLAELVSSHQRRNAFATLLVHKRDRSNSILCMDGTGRITRFLERPTDAERRQALAAGDAARFWVNSGVQVLSQRVLGHIPTDRASDLPRDIYAPLVNAELIGGVPLTGHRIAIDSLDRYIEAQEAVAQGWLRL